MSPVKKKMKKDKKADLSAGTPANEAPPSFAPEGDKDGGGAATCEGRKTDAAATPELPSTIVTCQPLCEQTEMILVKDTSCALELEEKKLDTESSQGVVKKPQIAEDEMSDFIREIEEPGYECEEEEIRVDELQSSDGRRAENVATSSMVTDPAVNVIKAPTPDSSAEDGSIETVPSRIPIRAPSPDPWLVAPTMETVNESEDIEEIMMSDYHKYAQYYEHGEEGEEKPKDPKKKALARETSASIQQFRKYTWSIREDPYEAPDALPQSLQENKFVMVPSSRPYALYMAVETDGGSFICTPIRREVVADDRPDLYAIRLDCSAYDSASARNFDTTDIYLMDILFIEEIVRRQDARPEDFITSVEQARKLSNHRYWKVKTCCRLPRDMLYNESGMHIVDCDTRKTKSFLVNNVEETAVARVKDCRGADISKFVAIDVIRPLIQPGAWLPGFKPPFGVEDRVLRSVQYHLDLPHILPQAIKVYPLDERRVKLLEHAPDVFSRDVEPTQQDFMRLQTLTKFGIYTSEAMASAYYDGHKYYGQVERATEGRYTEIVIKLTLPEGQHFAKEKWRQGTRLSLRFESTALKVTLLSIVADKGSATIRVKPLRRDSFVLKAAEAVGLPVFAMHQLENPRQRIFRLMGIKTIPRFRNWMPAMTLLVALHGGKPLPPLAKREGSAAYSIAGLNLTDEQGAVLSLMKSEEFIACTVNCGPGSGKTTTVMSALVKCVKSASHEFAVFTGNSNSAVTQGVATLKRLDPEGSIPAIRLISASHRQVVDESATTDIDFPCVWPEVLRKQVLLEDESDLKPRQYTISAVMHLKRNLLIRKRDLRNRYLRDAITDKPGEKPEQPAHSLMETLFRIMKPKVIIGTADTLRQTFKTEPFLDNWKTWVRNVVVDESSQIGHHTVTNLAFCFPRGKFLFVGDAMQLPPYAEHSYPQNLYRIHSGPVFANTIHRQLIPNLALTRCYRCPSQSVELISRLYYNGQLTAAKKPSNENTMLKRLGLPDRTPSVIINTSSEERKEGTSWTNQQEMMYAIRLAERFLATPECEGKTMAIISFYLAQSQEVAAIAPAGIHVGSVDATQGREYDLVVLLTTRSQEFSEFACSPERFTVAVSRHREALVVLGNTRRMMKPDNWKALLDATAKSSIINATAVPFLRNSSKDRSEKFNFDNFWLSEIRRSGQSEKCRVSCNNFSNDKLIRFDNNRIHRNEDWTSTGATRGRSEESHTRLACLMRKIDE